MHGNSRCVRQDFRSEKKGLISGGVSVSWGGAKELMEEEGKTIDRGKKLIVDQKRKSHS